MAKTQNAAYVSVAAIPAADTSIDMKRACKNLQIVLSSGSSDLYVEINGDTASVGGATCIKIASGGTWQSPQGERLGIKSFRVCGSGAVGTMQIVGI